MAAARQETEMPFLDHLEELRQRLFWILGALVVGVVIAFAVMMRFDVMGLMLGPISPYLPDEKLIFTNPGDPFRVLMVWSFALGAVFAFPIIAWHVWGFLSSALYTHEKKVVIPVLVGATLLFLAGMALAFFVILPITLRFLMGFQTDSMAPMITVSGYFSFVVGLVLAFGAVFEMPIVVVALTALGLTTPAFLSRFRRHAAVLCLVVAAIITPGGDPMSLLIMTLPLYLLYEVSIVLSGVVYRRKLRHEQSILASEGAGV